MVADAAYLSTADVDRQQWVAVTDDAHPAYPTWMGPASEHSRSASVVRAPAGIPAAVAMTGTLGLHAAAAERFYPHPSVRFVPMDGDPCRIAVASRDHDDRPAIAAFRRAAELVTTV